MSDYAAMLIEAYVLGFLTGTGYFIRPVSLYVYTYIYICI